MDASTPTISSPERQVADPGIIFDDLRFRYGDPGEPPILSGVSASFRRDRISLITGPSGSGKSTLLYLAAGIYPRHAGAIVSGGVRVEGTDPSEPGPRDRSRLIGMVFQNASMQFCMDTVENELLFCLGNACTPPGSMQASVREALAFCGIEHLRHRVLRTLSGGEKQLVALASIVTLRPTWLVLDEPFANVDEASAGLLARKVEELHRQGTGVLIVDHRLDHWEGVVADVWMLDQDGRLARADRAQAFDAGNRPVRFSSLRDHLPDRDAIERRPTRLEVRSLEVSRDDRQIVRGLDYRFRAGTVYAITGRSGGGKSTLFDAMLGAVTYGGDITLDGRPIHSRRGRIPAGAIGFVTQDPRDQFVADTVFEEVATSVRQGHRPGGLVEDVVEQTLRPIGLWGYRWFSPYMLSQGQQRRLGVAALLGYKCSVLVCDEPTYAQDDDNASAIMSALLETVRTRGVTLIFSTHDLDLARCVADVVLCMEGGHLREVD